MTNLYMWVAVVVVLSVVPYTRLGQRRHKQDWWGPQTTVAAAIWLVDLTCSLVSCCIYTQTGLDGGLIDNTMPSLARLCGDLPPGSKAFA